MGVQRTPGVMGLWEDPSSTDAGPWFAPGSCPAIPAGTAADALLPTGVVGLTTPGHLDMLQVEAPAKGAEETPTIPDRYRFMEVQGKVVKVKCNPTWVVKAMELGSAQEDQAEVHAAFVKMVSKKKTGQAELIATVTPYFRACNKHVLADSVESCISGGLSWG